MQAFLLKGYCNGTRQCGEKPNIFCKNLQLLLLHGHIGMAATEGVEGGGAFFFFFYLHRVFTSLIDTVHERALWKEERMLSTPVYLLISRPRSSHNHETGNLLESGYFGSL